MYPLTYLLILLVFHFASCQNIVCKCENTWHQTNPQQFEKNASLRPLSAESQFEIENDVWFRLKRQIELFGAFKSALQRKFENFNRAFQTKLRFLDSEQKTEEGRTFGIRRRMQLFFILPISFKLGVIITLLMVLMVMSFKGLLVGFLILILILINTNTSSKLWSIPKATELIDSGNRNVHIHVHSLPTNSYYHPYVENTNHWQERSLELDFRNN